jgi:hypothetical protein
MWKNVAQSLRDLASVISSEGDVKKIFRPTPKVKPPRRKPSIQNITQQEGYSTKKVKEFREEGGDYQKMPDAVKKLRREQRKKLRENLKAKKPLKAVLIDQELQMWQGLGNKVDSSEFNWLCDRRGFDEEERQILAEELVDLGLLKE